MIKHVSALVISMENGLGSETFEGKDKMEVLIHHLAFDEWPPAGKYQIVAILKHFSVKIIKSLSLMMSYSFQTTELQPKDLYLEGVRCFN